MCSCRLPHVLVFAIPSPIIVREPRCRFIYFGFVVVHQVGSGVCLVIAACEHVGFALVHLCSQTHFVCLLPLLHAEVPYLLGGTSESVRRQILPFLAKHRLPCPHRFSKAGCERQRRPGGRGPMHSAIVQSGNRAALAC
jgi:hypothetical protein